MVGVRWGGESMGGCQNGKKRAPLKILKGGGKHASEPCIRDLDQAPGSLISIILKDRV